MIKQHFMIGLLALAFAPMPVLADDGDLDRTFGIGGRVRYQDSMGYSLSASASAIQSDGKIIVAGSIGVTPDSADFDTTFGIDGKVTTDFLGWGDAVRAVAIRSDGKIVAAGMMVVPPSGTPYSGLLSGRGALVRYNKDGSLDTTFGTGGKVMTDILGTSEVNAISIQSDGKIIAAGRSVSVNDILSSGTDWNRLWASPLQRRRFVGHDLRRSRKSDN